MLCKEQLYIIYVIHSFIYFWYSSQLHWINAHGNKPIPWITIQMIVLVLGLLTMRKTGHRETYVNRKPPLKVGLNNKKSKLNMRQLKRMKKLCESIEKVCQITVIIIMYSKLSLWVLKINPFLSVYNHHRCIQLYIRRVLLDGILLLLAWALMELCWNSNLASLFFFY